MNVDAILRQITAKQLDLMYLSTVFICILVDLQNDTLTNFIRDKHLFSLLNQDID